MKSQNTVSVRCGVDTKAGGPTTDGTAPARQVFGICEHSAARREDAQLCNKLCISIRCALRIAVKFGINPHPSPRYGLNGLHI